MKNFQLQALSNFLYLKLGEFVDNEFGLVNEETDDASFIKLKGTAEDQISSYIYCMLLFMEGIYTPDVWTRNEYNDLKIHHRYRALKSANINQRNGLKCQNIRRINNGFIVVFNNDLNEIYELNWNLLSFNSTLSSGFISDILDTKNGNNNLTLLDSILELIKALDHMISFDLFQVNNETNSPFNNAHNLYLVLRDSFNNGNELQKRFISTVFGAALFYLPQPVNGSWDKKISIATLKKLVLENTGRKVKDHKFSRKRAAEEILGNDNLSLEEFISHYNEKYRIFTYLLPEENMALVNWHLDDANIVKGIPNYEKALSNNGIAMVDIRDLPHRNINKLIKKMKENLNTIDRDCFNYSLSMELRLNSFIFDENLDV